MMNNNQIGTHNFSIVENRQVEHFNQGSCLLLKCHYKVQCERGQFEQINYYQNNGLQAQQQNNFKIGEFSGLQNLQSKIVSTNIQKDPLTEVQKQKPQRVLVKWNRTTQYELVQVNNRTALFRLCKDSKGAITKEEVRCKVPNINDGFDKNSSKLWKIIRQIELINQGSQEIKQIKLLGGGQCSGKPRKIDKQEIKQMDQKKQSILLGEHVKSDKKHPEKVIEEYTYQMNEEQLEKVNSIVQKLRFQSPFEEVNSRFVSALFLEIYEVFSQVLSRGITNAQTQQVFQQLLEGGVNFLLSLIYCAEKQKCDLFDDKMKARILEKIKKTQKLFKQYETRLPLQIGVFLLKYQKKIIQLKRKQLVDSPSSKILKLESQASEWGTQYHRFCFGGFQDVDFNHLQNLINSLQIYYEYNKNQKFVVELLKTEFAIIKKYTDVLQKKVGFEEYFETILKDYENKEFCSIFYSYLMLFDQIFESCKNLEEIDAQDPKKHDQCELAAHFIKLVSGDIFIDLCRRTFYYENLKQETARKKFINQLQENYFLRYVELKILIQTYKLVKILEQKSRLTEYLQGVDLKNIERLELQIFEKFLQESSCEVNCLIYDDEQMLKLIENLNTSIDDSYYDEFREKIGHLKQKLEKIIINSLQYNENETVNHEKEDHMIQQLLGRKITFSLAMNDPKSAISNRFIEAFINRVASKKNDSLHEKGSTIHVNQRLKFVSNNALSKTEINVDGLVEDSLQMLEKYFLAESNTSVNVVAIKGGPGMGKTHLCRELMKRLMKQIQDTGSRTIAIPILVEMIEVENISQHLDLESFLNSSIERYAFRSHREIFYLKNSTIPKVIILDGLSEWSWGSPSISIRDWIRLREWQNTKLIITYRRPFVRAEEFPYFFGQKCKQPQDIEENNMLASNHSSKNGSPVKKFPNLFTIEQHQHVNTFQEDDREKCFEVFQILSLSQENVEDYIRQKEEQVRVDVKGKRKGSMSLDSSMVSNAHVQTSQQQSRNRSLSTIRDIEPGFLINTFRACTRKNTHLIDMLEQPFNLFCFAEIVAKVQGLKEIYWGGGGTKEERRQAAAWFINQEEMQEKLFIEEINGLIAEADIEEELRPLCNENCIEFFQSLAMNLFVTRKFKVTLHEMQILISQQMKTILKSGGTKQEISSFEKSLVTIIQNISRTSFLASNDISFFQFVTGATCEETDTVNEIQSMKELELNFPQLKGAQNLPATSQLYSFRNTPWLEFIIARAMKYDFDKFGNTLHTLQLQDLQKFAINTRYLLEERSVGEHNPFSISQQTNHAPVEMNVLKKLATIIRKDLLHEDFQNKLSQKDLSQMHRYIQMIQRTRRRPKKYYEQKPQQTNAQTSKTNFLLDVKNQTVEEWVIKHQKHPLDIASSNILSAICYNKLSLGLVKLRNCSFSRAYLYGYRGDLDIACSDVSDSNLRGSSIIISRSKVQHCLIDDEKNNHERWNSSFSYTYSALHFAGNSKLLCGSFNGGLSVFVPQNTETNKNNNNNKKKNNKKENEDEKNPTNTLEIADPHFSPIQFWNMTSFQRQFQEEVRAISTYKGDIYYAFLNIIAHVNENGEEKELVIGHQNKINDMCISEVHSTLATVSSDHTIRIWKIVNPDLKEKAKKQETQPQQKPAQQVKPKVGFTAMPVYGENGELIDDEEGKDDRDVDVEESFAEMELLHTLNRHDAEVVCCCYSPNGLYLATGSYDEVVYVWDIKSQYQKTISLSIKNDWILSIQFSSDSSMLIAGSSQSFIKIWDATKPEFPTIQQISTRRQRRDSIILGNTQNKNDCIGGISCVRMSPNCKMLLFSTFDEPGIQVYELVKNSTPKQYVPSQTKKILYLDESVMGQDYSTRRMPYFLVNNMTFSPDGKLLAVASQSQTLCSIWNIDLNFKPPKQAQKNGSSSSLITPNPFKINSVLSPNKVAAMAISHDGRYMATCAGLASPHKDSCRITIWCVMKRGEQAIIMQTLDAGLHSQAVSSLCFSPDNSFLVSASEDDHFVAWKNVSTHSDPLPLLSLSRQNSSHDSRRFSSGPGMRHNSINQSNMNQYMYLEAFKRVSAHKQPITAISFSIDCRYLVTASAKERSCKVWNGHTFDFSHQIQWEEEIAISKLEFSTNGLYLATLPLPSVVTSTVSAIYQNRKGSRRLTVQRKQSILYQQNSVQQAALQHQQSQSKHNIQPSQNQTHNQVQVQSRSSCCFLWNASERFSYYGIVGTVKNKEGRAFQTQIISMCFSKDSSLFVTGQTNGLCNVWDAQNRFHFIQSVDAHFSSITHLTFSNDSQMLASTAFDQTCKIWHVPNRFHEISSFYVPLETSSIQFVRQGHSIAVASTSDEFCLKFVDVYSPNFRIEELRAHSASISQTIFSIDGRFLLTASQDNTVRIWDLKNHFNQHYTINLNFRQNTSSKTNNILSKQEQNQEDNQLESKKDIDQEEQQEDNEGGDQNGQETDRYKGIHISPMKKKKSTLKHDIYFSIEDPDGEEDGILETEQDATDGKKVNNIQSQPGGIKRNQKRKLSLFAAPHLKPSQLYQNKIQDLKKDEDIDEQDYDQNIGGIVTAAISEKGTFVFVVTKEESKSIQLYDLTRGVDDVRESIILEHPDQITCLTLSPKDEYLATGSANTEIRIWKRTSFSPLTCELELEKLIEGRHTKQISCLAFSPNMKYFASGSWDITCKVYDVQNGYQLIHNLDGQYGYLLSLAFSPCSQQLSITSRDYSCYVWDIDNRLVQEEKFDHRQAVTACSYSPQYLATVSKDQSFILYDIKDNYKLARKMENIPAPITNCCLSPDGKYLVLGLQNSLVQVWDLLNVYDLTTEIQNDNMYKQILNMENELNENVVLNQSIGQSICNFISDEEVKEEKKKSLPADETESQHEQMLKDLPKMKKDCIGGVLRNSIQQYRESNNLQFDVNYTSDGHILVIVPKYPMCVVTL